MQHESACCQYATLQRTRLDEPPTGFLGPSNTEASSSELVATEERIQAGTSPRNGTSDRPKGAVTLGVASDETQVSDPTLQRQVRALSGETGGSGYRSQPNGVER